MAKKRQHLDDFLREKLNELPNAPVGDFKDVERRMTVKDHRGIVLLMLVPFIITGLYWMLDLSEKDLVIPSKPGEQIEQPAISPAVVDEQSVKNQKILESTHNVANQEPTPFKPVPSSSVAKKSQPILNTEEPLFAANGYETPQSKALETSSEAPQMVTESILAVAEGLDQSNVESDAYTPAEVIEESIIKPAQQNGQYQSQNTVQDGNLAPVPMLANTSRWTVLTNFYPNYTFREFGIAQDYKDVVNQRYEDIIKNSERGGFAFNISLDVAYELGKGVFLGSGLGYMEMKVNGRYRFNINEEIITTKSEPGLVGKTESVSAYQVTPIDQGIIQSYRYLQVPLHIRYQRWATQKLMVLAEGGISYVRFLGADGASIDYKTLVPIDIRSLDYTKNLASVDFKIGMAYAIDDQISVGLQPSLMYFTKSIYSDNSPINVVPWSVGVNFNVTMCLY